MPLIVKLGAIACKATPDNAAAVGAAADAKPFLHRRIRPEFHMSNLAH